MARAKRSEDREQVGRKARVPMGVARAKLSFPKRKGYVRRWFNDSPGRLKAAEDGGWAFVMDDTHVGDNVADGNTDIGAKVSLVVGKGEGGTPLRAFLMEIKEKWYIDDQKAKQKPCDAIDDAIRSGSMGPQEGQYIPKGGIKYQP